MGHQRPHSRLREAALQKQDNSKNQIYLGSGLDGVTNFFPATVHARSGSESAAKRRSSAGQPKLEAPLERHLLDRETYKQRHTAARAGVAGSCPRELDFRYSQSARSETSSN